MAICTLYICYFGIREPLVQTQVLPYLRQIAAAGIQVHLLTFEPGLRQRGEEVLNKQREQLAAEGISWFFLPYHKWPSFPATLYDIAAGAWKTFRLARAHKINVIHARGALPSLIAMISQPWTRYRLIFDVRGLNADEYVDSGLWKANSLQFHGFKAIERLSWRKADQLVVLTERMRDWLVQEHFKSAERIEVIPCCVDFSRFARGENEKLSAPPDRFEVVYAGSVTGLYLLEEMAEFFLAIRKRKPDAFFRILTTTSPAEVGARLERAGLNANDFWIGSVTPDEVPQYLRRARLGLSFRKPEFAQIASSPTKIAEYLAAGVPVICNSGVGDVDTLMAREKVGVVLDKLDATTYAEAAKRALELAEEPEVRARCIAAARRNFDLVTVGGARYCSVYRRIAEEHHGL